MRHLLAILAALCLLAAPAAAQTMKALMYSTNGNVIAPNIAFTNQVSVLGVTVAPNGIIQYDGNDIYDMSVNSFVAAVNFDQPAATRANLGFSTNLNTLWTATNASNARTAIGLGIDDDPVFNGATIDGDLFAQSLQTASGTNSTVVAPDGIEFAGVAAATTRTNLGLGATNIVTFAGITNNGDIRINQTTPTNGLLFVYRTNNEPFLGIANLIASNNTTLSNETLFRVGRAEATNQAAQFGFRIVRTNNGGEGFATFSVFGYNALMMIGPSDRSRTNTNAGAAIEADIYTMTGTNRVMTLRDTNTGALTLHQELGFGGGLTNTAPTNTTTPAAWLRVWVGTNGNYRLPLYQ